MSVGSEVPLSGVLRTPRSPLSGPRTEPLPGPFGPEAANDESSRGDFSRQSAHVWSGPSHASAVSTLRIPARGGGVLR